MKFIIKSRKVFILLSICLTGLIFTITCKKSADIQIVDLRCEYRKEPVEIDDRRPRFNYHGFQFAEITGLSKKPGLSMLSGIAISSDPAQTGHFECSNPELNQLWNNILWTQRDYQHGIPTDCPQRDERMGWMDDALVFAQTTYQFESKYLIHPKK